MPPPRARAALRGPASSPAVVVRIGSGVDRPLPARWRSTAVDARGCGRGHRFLAEEAALRGVDQRLQARLGRERRRSKSAPMRGRPARMRHTSRRRGSRPPAGAPGRRSPAAALRDDAGPAGSSDTPGRAIRIATRQRQLDDDEDVGRQGRSDVIGLVGSWRTRSRRRRRDLDVGADVTGGVEQQGRTDDAERSDATSAVTRSWSHRRASSPRTRACGTTEQVDRRPPFVERAACSGSVVAVAMV